MKGSLVSPPEVPIGMDIADGLEFRKSEVDKLKLGVFALSDLEKGHKFGPYKGDKVNDIRDVLDTNYVWEIIDPESESEDVLWYIDATEPEKSNWLRYINCARYFEEQNMVSEQEGTDIYYRTIKEVSAGDELLTWFDKSALASLKKKKRKGRKPNQNTSPKTSPKGKKRKESNSQHPEEELDDSPVKSRKTSISSNNASPTGKTSGPNRYPPPQEGEYLFELHKKNVVYQAGKKMYKCDICTGTYRHAFSLKRHYIRNHINYAYICEADRLNCCIKADEVTSFKGRTARRQEELMKGGELKLSSKGDQNNNKDRKEKGVTEENKVDVDNEVSVKEETESKDKDESCSDGAENHGTPAAEEVSMATEDVKDTEEKLNEEEGNDAPPAANEEGEKSEEQIKSEPTNDGSTNEVVDDQLSAARMSLTPDEVAEKMPGLYRCNLCNNLFDYHQELKHHLDNHPTKSSVKTYSCDQCDMKFSQKQNLMRHVMVHTGAKPYECKFCHKHFPTATNQKRHEMIHLGRKVVCLHCNNAFSQSGDLKKHIKRVHPEYFYDCAFCPKYFSMEKNLLEHLLTHNESAENNDSLKAKRETNAVFDTNQDREESMYLAQQKSGFKFACTVCKKRFHNYANMCRHRRLAHQRHLLGMSKSYTGSDSSESKMDAIDGFDDDDDEAEYFAHLSENIAENLTMHVDGKASALETPEKHFRSEVKEGEESPEKTQMTSPTFDWDKYNFPNGFKAKRIITPQKTMDNSVLFQNGDSDNIKRAVLQGTARKLELSNEDKKNMSCSDVKPPLIQVPELHKCHLCMRVFHRRNLFHDHMVNKHGCGVRQSKISNEKGHVKTTSTYMLPSQNGITPVDMSCISVPGDRKSVEESRSENNLAVSRAKSDKAAVESITQASGSVMLKSFMENDVPTQHEPLDLSVHKNIVTSEREVGTPNPAEELHFSAIQLKSSASPTESIPSSQGTPDLHAKFPGKLMFASNEATDTFYYDDFRKYICMVCYAEFWDPQALFDHQVSLHSKVACQFIETDKRFQITWCQTPNPVGLLTGGTPQNNGTDNLRSKGNIKCTKCLTALPNVEALHEHIMTCASPVCPEPQIRDQSHRVMGRRTKVNIKKKKYYRRKQGKEIKTGRIPGLIYNSLSGPSNSLLHMASVRKRRRNFGLLYNPGQHIRRREMTELVDMHECQGCGAKFKTILLLERHIKKCDKKDKLKDVQVRQPLFIEGVYEQGMLAEKKHRCHYCQKNFVYPGSLRTHVFKICSVRKHRLQNGCRLDLNWEADLKQQIRLLQAEIDRMSSGSSSPRTISLRGRRRKKRKNHRWTTVKRRKETEHDSDDGDEWQRGDGGAYNINGDDGSSSHAASTPAFNTSDGNVMDQSDSPMAVSSRDSESNLPMHAEVAPVLKTIEDVHASKNTVIPRGKDKICKLGRPRKAVTRMNIAKGVTKMSNSSFNGSGTFTSKESDSSREKCEVNELGQCDTVTECPDVLADQQVEPQAACAGTRLSQIPSGGSDSEQKTSLRITNSSRKQVVAKLASTIKERQQKKCDWKSGSLRTAKIRNNSVMKKVEKGEGSESAFNEVSEAIKSRDVSGLLIAKEVDMVRDSSPIRGRGMRKKRGLSFEVLGAELYDVSDDDLPAKAKRVKKKRKRGQRLSRTNSDQGAEITSSNDMQIDANESTTKANMIEDLVDGDAVFKESSVVAKPKINGVSKSTRGRKRR